MDVNRPTNKTIKITTQGFEIKGRGPRHGPPDLGCYRIAMLALIASSLSLISNSPVLAQLIPDASLGAESSAVRRDAIIREGLADAIEGGAIRGANLFHSFLEFNVAHGQRVYFTNPAGIENILTRVTGTNSSNIFGTLGIDGTGNLFLLNPNGILFGANAQLDLTGSFVATTGDSLVFDNNFEFSSRDGEAPPLLAVKVPMGLGFAEPTRTGPININQGNLSVLPGETLALIGGHVILDGGTIEAPSGNIVLGSLTAAGTVRLNPDFSLSFPEEVPRGDVTLTNHGGANVRGDGGGNIAIHGDRIEIKARSQLLAGIASGFGSTDTQAGNIQIEGTGTVNIADPGTLVENLVESDATGAGGDINITAESVNVTELAEVLSNTTGTGNAGNINITATENITVDFSSVFSRVRSEGEGNSGNINIVGTALEVLDGAQIQSRTLGKGDGGTINITTTDRVTFAGIRDGFRAGADSGVGITGEGNGGDITIVTPSLILDSAFLNASTAGIGDGGNINLATDSLDVTNDTFLNTTTDGFGNAGNIEIVATGKVNLDFSTVVSRVNLEAFGDGGNINLTAGELAVTNGTSIDAGTVGTGNGGLINLNAEKVIFDGMVAGFRSEARTDVAEGAVGHGGEIAIAADSLAVTNGAQLLANTAGLGNGGEIAIDTDSLAVTNGAQLRVSTAGLGNAGNVNLTAHTVAFDNSRISAVAVRDSVGNGGDINIDTDILQFTNDSTLSTASNGQGDAGSVSITATNQITFDGRNSAIITSVGRTLDNQTSNSGNIEIATDMLELTNGATFSAANRGLEGDSGNITIAANTVRLEGNGFFGGIRNERFSGLGDGGEIEIVTGSLEIALGAGVVSEFSGNGKGGNINITARDSIQIDGSSSRISTLFAQPSRPEFEEGGEAGDINITTTSLELINRAEINTLTLAKGNAGNINISASEAVKLDGGTFIASDVLFAGRGNGGNIEIATSSLELTNSAAINASTSGQGNAGNIFVRQADSISLQGNSVISAQVRSTAIGEGGTMDLETSSLALTDGSQLRTLTEGTGAAGDIEIDAADFVTISGIGSNGFSSGLFTQTESAATAGDITINTPRLNILDSGLLSALTTSSGAGGIVTIQAPQLVTLGDNSQITAQTTGAGKGGEINITTANLTLGGATQLNPMARETNSNGAQISTLSEGEGDAGNIFLNLSGTLSATHSEIITTATEASGGMVNVTANNILLRNSDLQTNVFSGAGGGGNINLTANSIVGFDDSDILSFARDGRGGNITLDTPAFFSESFRLAASGADPANLDGNNRGDVNASGAVNGIIILPDVSFIYNSLPEFPENIIDTDRLIANSCIVPSNNSSRGNFFVTGAGALPQRPGDLSLSPYPTGTVRGVPHSRTGDSSGTSSWKKGDPILEPTGVYQLPNGKLIISRDCPSPL